MTALVLFVCVFHFAAFIAEAFLWMHPSIHEPVLSRLSGPFPLDLHAHALVLQNFLVNQGFYNLFLALAGISGMVFLKRGRAQIGHTLIVYMCLSAVGAGVVLAISTSAYVGAFFQGGPAVVALAHVARSAQQERPVVARSQRADSAGARGELTACLSRTSTRA